MLSIPGGGGGRGTPSNGLYGKSPPKRVTFFKLQQYERVGMSPVEVHESPGISVVTSVKGPKRANRFI